MSYFLRVNNQLLVVNSSFLYIEGDTYEAETLAHISRVETDSGVVPDPDLLNDYIKAGKTNGWYSYLISCYNPTFGVRYDSSMYIDKLYDLNASDPMDMTQGTASIQPLLGSDQGYYIDHTGGKSLSAALGDTRDCSSDVDFSMLVIQKDIDVTGGRGLTFGSLLPSGGSRGLNSGQNNLTNQSCDFGFGNGLVRGARALTTNNNREGCYTYLWKRDASDMYIRKGLEYVQTRSFPHSSDTIYTNPTWLCGTTSATWAIKGKVYHMAVLRNSSISVELWKQYTIDSQMCVTYADETEVNSWYDQYISAVTSGGGSIISTDWVKYKFKQLVAQGQINKRGVIMNYLGGVKKDASNYIQDMWSLIPVNGEFPKASEQAEGLGPLWTEEGITGGNYLVAPLRFLTMDASLWYVDSSTFVLMNIYNRKTDTMIYSGGHPPLMTRRGAAGLYGGYWILPRTTAALYYQVFDSSVNTFTATVTTSMQENTDYDVVARIYRIDSSIYMTRNINGGNDTTSNANVPGSINPQLRPIQLFANIGVTPYVEFYLED